MSKLLDFLSWLLTVRPAATLVVLAGVTIALGSGAARLASQADSTAFLPEDSDLATATTRIEELFGGRGGTTVVTVIFRGEALTPDGLAQMDDVLKRVAADPRVEPLLAPRDPIVAPSLIIAAALGTDDVSSLSSDQIEEAAGQLGLGRLVGVDADGSGVAIATIELLTDADGDGETSDDTEVVTSAELAIRDIAEASRGTLHGGSLSPATTNEDAQMATGAQMTLLIGLALAVIAGLLLLFMRSLSDLLLSLLGLVVTIVWVTGAQGWLGPNGMGLIGPPNALTTMVPIMLMSLVVDYAIQAMGLYRERRGEGHGVRAAARLGLRAVMIPLSLAAVTTIVSFLTNLTSPIPANSDFGIVAGVGVAAGLIVTLLLIAPARALLDRRPESRGSLPPARPISGAIPGFGAAVGALGGQLARRPVPFLVAIGIITLLLGIASTRIETAFDSRDFLPSGGDTIRNFDTLDAAFGGSTGPVQVLIEAEITEDRTIRNLLDFGAAFDDDLRRPEGVVSGIQSSLGLLLLDWVIEDGTPGDPYDEQLAAMTEAAAEFRLDPLRLQAIFDRLEELDPGRYGEVIVDRPDGPDSLLLQFEALTGDQERTMRMVQDIEGLWFGRDEEIATTSDEVVALEVVNTMTTSQTVAITTTILAALIILSLFFWITEGRPALGFIAVGPIVMVLLCVLGTMALAGIPYNVVTALITALSIGIGVDYTIHVIHRYEEEFARSRDPEAAARRTLETTGSALLGSALTTALGFGVLMFSSLTLFQQFGIVTAITIGYALIAAVVVVPPAMILWAAYQNHRLRSAAARASTELSD